MKGAKTKHICTPYPLQDRFNSTKHYIQDPVTKPSLSKASMVTGKRHYPLRLNMQLETLKELNLHSNFGKTTAYLGICGFCKIDMYILENLSRV